MRARQVRFGVGSWLAAGPHAFLADTGCRHTWGDRADSKQAHGRRGEETAE